jgi:Pyruvate kinase
LMLSGETAYGKYPVEALRTMAKIAEEAEKDKLSENDIRIPLNTESQDVTAFLAKQAVKATAKINIRAIITDSYTGRTARNVAAFRGRYPVMAMCYNEKIMRLLALSYGVLPIFQEETENARTYFFEAIHKLLDSGRIVSEDRVAYLSGSFGEGGGTTFLEINTVSKVLANEKNYLLPTFTER